MPMRRGGACSRYSHCASTLRHACGGSGVRTYTEALADAITEASGACDALRPAVAFATSSPPLFLGPLACVERAFDTVKKHES
eukprot:6185861-Pleurochrysis_carterae.AAC.5